MNYPEALEYIDSFINYMGAGKGRRFTRSMKRLGRIAALLEAAGNPHSFFRAVLVGGTKGKGSTASFLARILGTAGYTTGLYLSPHLVTVRERMLINGERISRDRFASAVTELKPYLDTFTDRLGKTTPSYFEILTACAFLFFKNMEADIAVLEVGMGGKYDATNITDPLVSVITSIGLEHTEFLGNTPAEIASEKCGIARRERPLITAVTGQEAMNVIEKKSAELNAPLYRLDREISAECGETVSVSFKGRTVDGIQIPLPGTHQYRNAAAAAAAAIELDSSHTFRITDEHIRSGIQQTRILGRIDIVSDDPVTIFDTAHTADSVRALMDTIHTGYPGKLIYGVFNISRDKDLNGIIGEFPANLVYIYTAPTGNPRNCGHTELASRLTEKGVEASSCESVSEAMKAAADRAGSSGIVLVFGSFFLTGRAYEQAGYTDE